MSKRRLETEIDTLSDDVLGDLSPDKRLQLAFRSRAEGNEQAVEKLMESCPRYDYQLIDRAFTNRLRVAQRYANHAIYGLHTAYLQYELALQKQRYHWLRDNERDAAPSDTVCDRTAERARTIWALFVELYTSYHAHRRFATEVLDVDLEMWVIVHPLGPTVVDAVVDVINDQKRIDLAETYLADLLEEEESEAGDSDRTAPTSEPMTLDDMVVTRYEMLRSIWANEIRTGSE